MYGLQPVAAEHRGALVAALLGLAAEPGAAPPSRFPGPSPVSIERASFARLAQDTYWACEKTDGVRAMLLCCELAPWGRVCVLADRALACFWAPLAALPTALFQGTLLDGELLPGEPGGGEEEAAPSFQAFDALAVAGIPVWQRGLSYRLAAVHAGLAAYRAAPADPLRVCIKCFFGPDASGALRDHLARLRVPRDGLVLTPETPGVKLGRHMGMFKFKPPGTHTVDFVAGPGGGAMVWDPARRAHARVADLDLTAPPAGPGAVPPGAVVECARVRPGVWAPRRVRDDKTHANDLLTFAKTELNIEEDLSEEEVLRAWAACSPPARSPP